MVKEIVLALACLTAVANADNGPAFNMFGFRMSAGALPLDGNRATVLSAGLGVEHPVFKKTRVFGEYEWLWVTWIDERAVDTGVIRPERHGNGHRASLGFRRELKAKDLGRSVRLFIDGELGGNVALTNDNMSGVGMRPGGLVGMRFGYDVYSGVDSSPSRTFEAEFLVRAIVVEHGAGALVGIGLAWGN
jgi:hypothetical protein